MKRQWEPELYLQYAWTGCAIEYHRAQIRKALGFKESSQEEELCLFTK